MRYVLPSIEALPLWPTIAAPVFLCLFLGLVWWTYKSSRKPIYDRVEQLPLEDDDNRATEGDS